MPRKNLCQGLHYWLQICLLGDLGMYHNRRHLEYVAPLFMLAMLLSKIVFVKDPDALPGLCLDRTESDLIYKYYMIRVSEDARTSHGEQSALARAANASVDNEAAMKGDPNSVLTGIVLGLRDLREATVKAVT